MGQKVCLDTDVVIALLNGENRVGYLIDKIESYKIFISAVTLFELLLRESGLDQIELFRSKVELLDFDELASRKASLVFKGLKKKGKIIDYRDLFIASTCIANNCKLVTFNKKHFENIKELKMIEF